MEFTLYELISAFGFSILLGIAFGVIYEPVRIFHKIGFSKPAHYFITDFLFMIICAFLTYFFCLVMIEGSVRLFVIIGEIIGFALYYFTLRRVTDRIFDPVINFSKKIILNLLKNIGKVMYNIKSEFNKLNKFLCGFIKEKVLKYVIQKKIARSERRNKLVQYRRSKASKAKKK